MTNKILITMENNNDNVITDETLKGDKQLSDDLTAAIAFYLEMEKNFKLYSYRLYGEKGREAFVENSRNLASEFIAYLNRDVK